MLFEMNNLQTQNSRGKVGNSSQEGADKEEDSL
jgi:hypothetical protein